MLISPEPQAIVPLTVEAGTERINFMRRTRLLTLLSHFIILLAVLTPATARQERRSRPYRYLVPEGYVGWVRVDFNVKEGTTPTVEDGFYMLKIPASGRLQTTIDDDEKLFLENEYYYFCSDSKQRLEVDQSQTTCMIRGEFQGPNYLNDVIPSKYRYFFVGPVEEYEKYRFAGENLENIKLGSDRLPKTGSMRPLTCKEQ
ncbi:MAG TPA: hypothetical protein VF544_00580 [Pyrinomonadaceae bacterium]